MKTLITNIGQIASGDIAKPSLDDMGPGTDREVPLTYKVRPASRSTQGLAGQRPKFRKRFKDTSPGAKIHVGRKIVYGIPVEMMCCSSSHLWNWPRIGTDRSWRICRR